MTRDRGKMRAFPLRKPDESGAVFIATPPAIVMRDRGLVVERVCV